MNECMNEFSLIYFLFEIILLCCSWLHEEIVCMDEREEENSLHYLIKR